MPEELLEKAVKLHEYLGPFLVFGLKMSLHAKKILGEKQGKCDVETINSKPVMLGVRSKCSMQNK